MAKNDYDPNFVPVKNYVLVGQKAVVINKEGKFLLLLRSEKAGGGGLWALPGGALEEGETPHESIEREIKEETELNIFDTKPFYAFTLESKGDTIVTIAYRALTKATAVKLNWEHDDYKWVDKNDALTMKLSSVARSIIEKI